jgi:hypothetical protein
LGFCANAFFINLAKSHSTLNPCSIHNSFDGVELNMFW